jgi:hypothetical protein
MNIIELAKQAGMTPFELFKGIRFIEVWLPEIETFAELVAAHEREECAKLFETITKDPAVPPVHFSLSDTAKLIRARGTT